MKSSHQHSLPLLVILILLLPLASDARQTNSNTNKPNIILIMADDLGYEGLSINGADEIKTPNLDRLAKGGVRFTNAFSNPICTPSRVKIMTGLYNNRNYVGFGKLARNQITFAHLAKQAGYSTAIAGKWQLGKEPDSPHHFGFDEAFLWQHTRDGQKVIEGQKNVDGRFVNPIFEKNGQPIDYTKGEYGPQLCADFLCEFIENKKDTPFLVYYPMILTHCPFDPTPDSDDWDGKRPGSTSYKGDLKQPQKHFKDMATYMDKIVGQIVNKLDQLSLRENTIILFTGDNGTDKPIVTKWNGKSIAGGKGLMSEEGIRVPLIVNWPENIKNNIVTDDLVDFADFLPTICDLIDSPLPEDYPGDGVSLWPTLIGEPREKLHAYVWFSGRAKFKGGVLARTKDYQYFSDKDMKNPIFSDVSRHYSPKTLDINDLSEDQKKIMLELKSKVVKMAKEPSLRSNKKKNNKKDS